MNKLEIVEKLKSTCDLLVKSVEKVNSHDFYASKNEKWSAAQNIAHLTFSTKIMNRAFSVSKIALWYKFGRRFIGESRSYETIINIYNEAKSKARLVLSWFLVMGFTIILQNGFQKITRS